MSAGLLNEAAMTIREEWGSARGSAWSSVQNFHLAVADLLENEAALILGVRTHPDLHMPLLDARTDALLAVARAYLGRDA